MNGSSKGWAAVVIACVVACGGTVNVVEPGATEEPNSNGSPWRLVRKVTRNEHTAGARLGEHVAVTQRWAFASMRINPELGFRSDAISTFHRTGTAGFVRWSRIGARRHTLVIALGAVDDVLYALLEEDGGRRIRRYAWNGTDFEETGAIDVAADACDLAVDDEVVVVAGKRRSAVLMRATLATAWTVDTPATLEFEGWTPTEICPSVALGRTEIAFALDSQRLLVQNRATRALSEVGTGRPRLTEPPSVAFVDRDLFVAGDPSYPAVQTVRARDDGSREVTAFRDATRSIREGGAQCESCSVVAVGGLPVLVDRADGSVFAFRRSGGDYSSWSRSRTSSSPGSSRALAATNDTLLVGLPFDERLGTETGVVDAFVSTGLPELNAVPDGPLSAADALLGFGDQVAWLGDHALVRSGHALLALDAKESVHDVLAPASASSWPVPYVTVVASGELVAFNTATESSVVQLARRGGESWTDPLRVVPELPTPRRAPARFALNGDLLAILSPPHGPTDGRPRESFVTFHRITANGASQVAQFALPDEPREVVSGNDRLIAVSDSIVLTFVKKPNSLRAFVSKGGGFEVESVSVEEIAPVREPLAIAVDQGLAAICDESGAIPILEYDGRRLRRTATLEGERCVQIAIAGGRVAFIRPPSTNKDVRDDATRAPTLVVYERIDGVFRKIAERTPTSSTTPSGFGAWLAFSGDRIAVSAPGERQANRVGGGAVYLYER
jgi:hypothetical protein